MRRRTFVTSLGVAGAALVGAPALLGARRPAYDVVLRGGVIIDGTGRPRFSGDVAVSGDRIARVARRIREQGRREIDCRGHVDRKSTRLNSSHRRLSRMPSSA